MGQIRLELAVANTYWDTLWEMAKAGSTFAEEANEIKHQVVNGESYVEIFSSIHQNPHNPFEVALKVLTTNKLKLHG